LPLLAAGGIYFLIKQSNGQSLLPLSTDAKRAAIIAFDTDSDSAVIYNQMTPAEIDTVYTFYFQYERVSKPVPDGDLKNRLIAISNKYNIFT